MATTETKYQEQMSVLTEYITTLQMQAAAGNNNN